ncbi:MAG: hypothetical protein NVS2B3_10600 [Vulcanimicrobiaceae bacterium]
MANLFNVIANTAVGTGLGFLSGGPAGAVVGGLGGAVNTMQSAGPGGNIAPGTDPTLFTAQLFNKSYELANTGLQAEQLRHQYTMQVQSQQFNEVQDEKSEQMREMNTLRSVAMKQRDADDKIVKEFIKTAGGE